MRESLELSGWLQPEMLIAANFGLCATVNDELVIKAPDWVYVARVERLIGNHYQLEIPDENGCHWFSQMNLFLGTWHATKDDRTGYWLRWWDHTGKLLPWGIEQVEHIRNQLEQERQRAKQERQRAELRTSTGRSTG